MSAEPTPSFVLGIKLSLMGRLVKSYTFGKPVITVGRDPDADVHIDNPGVSREHLRFERTPTGSYEAVDLGSANGTVLNDRPITGREPLNEGDHVRLGKFTLTVSYESDRRESLVLPHTGAPDADQHTMVLTRDELAKVMELQRKAEVDPPAPPPGVAGGVPAGAVSMSRAIGFMVATYLIGAATGATIMWFVLHRA